MHDIKSIRDNPQGFDAALARRGLAPMSSQLLAIDERRRAAIQSSELAQARRNAASNSGIVVLSLATSSINAAARASSLVFLASPISLEAALRHTRTNSEDWIAARRRSSMARSCDDNSTRPRRASPASKPCGLSRIDLMSCM